jgi:ATP-dependent helicase/nuclease subunit A
VVRGQEVVESVQRLEAEDLRVLYVAVTRAKEQFISFISCKNVENTIKRLSAKTVNGKIPPFVVKSINCDGDLLLLCALLHKDSHSIRKMAECEISIDESTDFPLEVNILGDIEGIEEKDITQAEADSALVKEIEEKLSFVYARASLSGYTAKLTASSLDEADQSYQFFAKKKPTFLQGEKLTGAQKGTAMHAFMQYCRYDAARDNLEEEIKRLTDNGFISAIQAQALNRDKLSKLFSSDFAKRMFSSDRIYRELKVEAFVPLNELEDSEFDDPVLIQGIADCVFEEDGQLVLVDYKTDYVKEENELLSLYKKQVAFYKRAVEKVLQKPVKEAMLYSFSLSKPCVYK